ncbi:hypothetical protein [Nonomuraea sp. NPDC001831]|uniref:hypothetical protein n=1 Tax=Nonomuraea sp. NPDC001831 TaxID=3364340 RepID=UPI0036A6D7B0
MSKEEVRQVVQLMRRRNDTVAEAIRATLQMRPSTINIHVSIGAIYDPLAIDCLNRLSQSERDKFLADNIRDSALAVSGGKLASRSFSLVSEHPLADKEVSDFEARINSLAGKLSEAV